MWFWPPKKKKLQNHPLIFHLWQFWPPRPILTRSTLTWHPKWGATCYFLFLLKIGIGGPKLLQLQNLGDNFVVFFLGGQNCNFMKVRGRKLLLSQFTKGWECVFWNKRGGECILLFFWYKVFYSFNKHKCFFFTQSKT